MMPTVDLGNSEQNAFVQDWLTELTDGQSPDDVEHIDAVVELIQERYSYQDHQARLAE